MRTLLDSLNNLAYPAVTEIARGLGEADTAVSRAIPATFASLLQALLVKSKDPRAFRPIFDLINSRPPSSDLTRDARNILGAATTGTLPVGNGERFLTMLFDGRIHDAAELIAFSVSFKNPTSGQTLLGLASPLLVSVLGKIIRDDGFRATDLTNLLERERGAIQAAVPPGLNTLLITEEASSSMSADRFRAERPSRLRHDVPTVKSPSATLWLWPVLAVGVFTLSLMVSRRQRPAERLVATAADSARAGRTLETSAGEVTSPRDHVGELVTRNLPDGVVLSVPEYGTESRLIAFIEDPARPVNDSTWFDFDHLNFVSGSATITPESEAQIRNVAKVLKAYPNVSVKIGGYTDNAGKPSENLRLSQQRASAVKQGLISNGISADRLQYEGYGEKYPVVDNATEQGRRRNRRVAIRVTEK
jgi:OmpA-OmpF porin, OOP family